VGGAINTISEAVTTATIGLSYTAQWKSTKLAYAQPGESLSLTHPKRVVQVGFVLADAYAQSLKFGPDFTTLDDLPLYEQDLAIVVSTVDTAYDEKLIEFPGEWSSDSRVCLQAASPRPVTVLAAVLSYDTNEKS
jgi:hypothetical protein